MLHKKRDYKRYTLCYIKREYKTLYAMVHKKETVKCYTNIKKYALKRRLYQAKLYIQIMLNKLKLRITHVKFQR